MKKKQKIRLLSNWRYGIFILENKMKIRQVCLFLLSFCLMGCDGYLYSISSVMKKVASLRKLKISSELSKNRFQRSSVHSTTDSITSPFDNALIPPEESVENKIKLALNAANVEKILDEEIRPHLFADGGNIEVISIDEINRKIELFLQGACSSCPASTVSIFP
jgi:Fe-S cluster biogenesis protein NfuA